MRFRSSQVTRILLTCLAAAAAVWAFFSHPGAIFYNRYFEAPMIFSPGFTTASYFQGWSTAQHLGYATLTEPVYLSVVTFVIWLIHLPAGTAWTSEIYPALVQLWIFGSFLVFIRKKRPGAGYAVAVLSAFFFAVNPITAAAIHEGYSGMLVDYGLFPWTLLLVDYAERRNLPILLAALPLIYTATSMFKFPEVAINLAALAALRWNAIVRLYRAAPVAAVWTLVAFFANAYWAAPVALNAFTHRSFPIQADTASEIAVTTHYSTLSNVVLGRVFGIFESDAGLCSTCGYYEGAWFNLGMLLIVVAAFTGLIRRKRWGYLGVAIAAIIFATGYHYQDNLIGVPYQILMGLPLEGVFRAANVFSFILFFCYAAGLADFLTTVRAGRATYIAALAAVVLAGLPAITGSLLEHGKPPAATFFVRVPNSYAGAREALDRENPRGVTLLLPNQSFAAYRWGASVQDFLPAYLRRPTISSWYWPQPSPLVQRVLDAATSAHPGSARFAALLRAMRVGAVFIHNDVEQTAPLKPRRYGRVIYRRGNVAVVIPPQSPLPAAEWASAPLTARTTVGAAVLAGRTGDAVLLQRGHGAPRPRPAVAQHLDLALGAAAWLRAPADAKAFVLHESDDPSWVLFERSGARLTALPHVAADGYANGWVVPGGASLLLVNLAQLAFLLGLAVAIAAAAGTIVVIAAEVLRRRQPDADGAFARAH